MSNTTPAETAPKKQGDQTRCVRTCYFRLAERATKEPDDKREPQHWVKVLLSLKWEIIWSAVFFAIGFLPVLVNLLPANWVSWLPCFAKDSLDWWGKSILWGFWASVFAGVMLASAAYIFHGLRVRIIRLFQPHAITIRAPMMLGVAPLIIAKKYGMWDYQVLNADLDFRYAGAKALEDLMRGDCTLAVASDIAICKFLGKKENQGRELRVMPFVRIEDHLKVLVTEKSQLTTIQQLRDLTPKKIGFYADSVHEDFLRVLQLCPKPSDEMIPANSVLECYRNLCVTNVASEQLSACVLWEPHYHAFGEKRFPNLRVLNKGEPAKDAYRWFLCLVATKSYTEDHPQTANRILLTMRRAVEHCADTHKLPEIAKECAASVLSDFTGIGEKELVELFEEHMHIFDIDKNMQPYFEKLTALAATSTAPTFISGASKLITPDFLWPGLERPGS